MQTSVKLRMALLVSAGVMAAILAYVVHQFGFGNTHSGGVTEAGLWKALGVVSLVLLFFAYRYHSARLK